LHYLHNNVLVIDQSEYIEDRPVPGPFPAFPMTKRESPGNEVALKCNSYKLIIHLFLSDYYYNYWVLEQTGSWCHIHQKIAIFLNLQNCISGIFWSEFVNHPYRKSWHDMSDIRAIKLSETWAIMSVTIHSDTRRVLNVTFLSETWAIMSVTIHQRYTACLKRDIFNQISPVLGHTFFRP
jgi:hypothetical protein